MNYNQFSGKQVQTLTWWNDPELRQHDAIICDGSVRSGKTISMAVGFVLWSMCCFNKQKFAICGKTIQSLRRNVVSFLPCVKNFPIIASLFPSVSAATHIICSEVRMKAAQR